MDSRVFVDSDVVISSLISSKGAAYHLIHEVDIKRFISNRSIEELGRVVEELGINVESLNKVIEEKFSKTEIKDSLSAIKKEYREYVNDENDAHVVAGAARAKSKFIITYNQRDFKQDKIKDDLSIILMTPAQFLQYLRSLL